MAILHYVIYVWIFLQFIAEANLHGGSLGENNFINLNTDVILELINGTQDYKITRNSKEDKLWYDGREIILTHCVREAKCEPLKYKTCLGSKLPYTSTSLHLAYSYSQEQVHKKLDQYAALKHIPKCWAVIQPYLCATFVPKCEVIKDREMVYLPSLEMCRNVMEPCKLVYNTTFFPEFLKCNESFLPAKCDNDVREMKFNMSGSCMPPLVHTDTSFHFYDGISGCGLPCRDPLYTEDEHNQISRLVMWGASINLALSLFAVTTFLIDWRSSSKYPALIIFYINVCCVISSIGWLSQFMFDSRGDIVCSKDGTRRQSEPSAGENLSCVIIFVLVYYFQIAQCVWFVLFTFAWDMSFKRLGKIEERIDKKGAYFHLIAWSLPLVLTITTMALGEIDGSSITGICFVGYLNHAMRAALLLGPLLVFLCVGEYFLSHCILTLVVIRTSSKDIISVRASSKIRATIMRCSITVLLKAVFIGATFACHIYEFRNSNSWYDSFRNFLVCRLTSTFLGVESNECVQSSRPSVAILQLQLLCLFCSMILMASWVWTNATLQTWKRYIRIRCGFEVEEPVRLEKYKLIAQAFARRKEFHNQGRMSISFHNTHTDPLGFKFDLNSGASHDFSSTWANNLPRFVQRRGALTGAQHSHSQSSNAPRRNSQDSQISFSVRHVSVESRRNSLDSQVSVKIAEMKTKVASRRRVKSHKSSRRRPQRNMTVCTRKESTTSIENHILKALPASKDRRHLSDSSNRRTAIAGLNKKQIDLFYQQFFETHGLSATSDDGNHSMASFKIMDSQLNIVLHQKDPNLSTEDVGVNSSTNEMALAKYCSDSENATGNELARIKYKSNNLVSSDDMRNSIRKRIRGKEYLRDVYGSKSSSKSKSSRKSSRQSGGLKTKRPLKTNFKCKSSKARDDGQRKKKNSNSMNNDFSKSSSESSYDSFAELGRLGNQSSYSGVSVDKNNSRNSKTSCDVGIQANSHEIATQTLTSHESTKKSKSNLLRSQNVSIKSANSGNVKDVNAKNKYKSNADNDLVVFYKNDIDYPEKSSKNSYTSNKNINLRKSKHDESNEPLLSGKHNTEKAIILKKRNDLSSMSESKKLKQLLLPSTK